MTTVAFVTAPSRADLPPSVLRLREPSKSFAPREPDADRSTALLSRLLTDAFDAFDNDRDIARTSLSRAVALLEAEQSSRPALRDLTTLAPWQSKKAVAHIDDHLASTIRIGDLAGLARLSTSYFSRAFKSTFGRTPQQFILDRRVARAQHVMLTSEETLCSVALTCGFSDQAHLSRVFRRIVGASPAQWRKTRRAAPRPGSYIRPYEA